MMPDDKTKNAPALAGVIATFVLLGPVFAGLALSIEYLIATTLQSAPVDMSLTYTFPVAWLLAIPNPLALLVVFPTLVAAIVFWFVMRFIETGARRFRQSRFRYVATSIVVGAVASIAAWEVVPVAVMGKPEILGAALFVAPAGAMLGAVLGWWNSRAGPDME